MGLFLLNVRTKLPDDVIELEKAILGLMQALFRATTNSRHQVLAGFRLGRFVFATGDLLLHGVLIRPTQRWRHCRSLQIFVATRRTGRRSDQLANVLVDDLAKLVDHLDVVHDVLALLLVRLLNGLEAQDQLRPFLNPLVVIVKELNEIRIAFLVGEPNVGGVDLLEILATTEVRVALQTIVRTEQAILAKALVKVEEILEEFVRPVNPRRVRLGAVRQPESVGERLQIVQHPELTVEFTLDDFQHVLFAFLQLLVRLQVGAKVDTNALLDELHR